MTNVIIRLPGGGRIKKSDEKQLIEWWDYRNHFIENNFYSELKEIIQKNQHAKFYFISGGVGAFIYTDLCKKLNNSETLRAQIGCDIVSIMHKILINSLIENRVDVFPNEISIKDLNSLSHKKNRVFFIKPDINFLSTDSLAASVANMISAEIIIYIKEGSPIYHAGFNEPTIMNQWRIADIKERAKIIKGNYIIDSEALNTIESLIKKNCSKVLILNPSQLIKLDLINKNYGFGQSEDFCEVII
ncbi:hypothetical protein ACNQO6_09695 [Acinetobacter calcoaceticus]|uniref:hypothetical protein n=1 Tax=Acinetobacter calcoaceticus TaxID=471 RepID=UPI003F7C7D74